MPAINVLSIAGLDPTGGAGLLADIKAFHQMKVNGFGVSTAYTFQTEDQFYGLEWATEKELNGQLRPLLERYEIAAVKIGLIESLDQLDWLLDVIRRYQPKIQIVWDPVWNASAGWKFHDVPDVEVLTSVLRKVDGITPNRSEMDILRAVIDEQSILGMVTTVLKGGHANDGQCTDILYSNGQEHRLTNERLPGKGIHGSGCVFSSILAACLAKNMGWSQAFQTANAYIHGLIEKSDSMLGIHHENITQPVS